MPHKKKEITEKPYNRCIACSHRIEGRCDGPRTSAMALARWCEYMRDMKDANELTNDDLAEGAGVSLKTIERLMSGHCDQDIMRETARRIEDVILGSSNRFPCILAFEEENKPTASRLEVALADLERVAAENAELRRQVEFLREENQLKAKIIDHFLDK